MKAILAENQQLRRQVDSLQRELDTIRQEIRGQQDRKMEQVFSRLDQLENLVTQSLTQAAGANPSSNPSESANPSSNPSESANPSSNPRARYQSSNEESNDLSESVDGDNTLERSTRPDAKARGPEEPQEPHKEAQALQDAQQPSEDKATMSQLSSGSTTDGDDCGDEDVDRPTFTVKLTRSKSLAVSAPHGYVLTPDRHKYLQTRRDSITNFRLKTEQREQMLQALGELNIQATGARSIADVLTFVDVLLRGDGFMLKDHECSTGTCECKWLQPKTPNGTRHGSRRPTSARK